MGNPKSLLNYWIINLFLIFLSSSSLSPHQSIPFMFSGIEKENIETISSQQTTYNVLYIITVQLDVIANGWY
jgi:hypothetical protein